MGAAIFRDILILFLCSIFVILLLRPFKLPAIIGFILTGALIGPFGVGLIRESAQINVLAELGVTLLLFAAGMEFSLASFARLKTYVIKGGTLQVLGTLGCGFLIGKALDWPVYESIYFGCMISLSSTAIVLSTFSEKRQQEGLSARVATGILILQDIAVIPMLIILPALEHGGLADVPWQEILRKLALAGALVAAAYVLIRHVSRPFSRLIMSKGNQDVFLLSLIVLAVGVAWGTHHMGLSVAFGAFLGGLIVGSTDYKAEALAEIRPFRICFNSLFFFSIGMLMDLGFLLNNVLLILALVAFIPLVKVLVLIADLIWLKASLRTALLVGISLGQIGEFAFVLASLGLRSGGVSPALYQIIIAVSAISMLLTPLMIQWSPAIAAFILKFKFFERLNQNAASESEAASPGGLENHVILCGYGQVGLAVSVLLREVGLSHLIVELNPEAIDALRQMGARHLFGDATSPEILHQAGIEKARLVVVTPPDHLSGAVIVKQAKKMNPGIRVIVRTRHHSHAPVLRDSGADIIVSEDLETGLEIGRLTLVQAGYSRSDTEAFVRLVRNAVD